MVLMHVLAFFYLCYFIMLYKRRNVRHSDYTQFVNDSPLIFYEVHKWSILTIYRSAFKRYSANFAKNCTLGVFHTVLPIFDIDKFTLGCTRQLNQSLPIHNGVTGFSSK